MSAIKIRLITENDAQQALSIYSYYVENTIISFEYQSPTPEEYLQRIRTNTQKYPWLVCEQNNQIIGFAYGSTHRSRTAYQWSPESTIYLDPSSRAKGIGTVLYKTLFDMLRLQGYVNVYAGVGLPNEQSVNFHLKMGFEVLGVFKKVGYKMGGWHDTKWFQLHLSEHIFNPPIPKELNEIKSSAPFLKCLENANFMLRQV